MLDETALPSTASPEIPTAAGSPRHPIRFITAAALFDGHDASINIIRRMLQAAGVEVIHLGHNRAVAEIAQAALHEDVQGIAISSYQGGHVEFFRYLVDYLRQHDGSEIQIFGGGGGVIVPEEIEALQAYGVARIYSPEDGRRLGLQGMIDDMIARTDFPLPTGLPDDLARLADGDRRLLARVLSAVQTGSLDPGAQATLQALAAHSITPVIGITGTGGAGKSSLTDELIRRFRLYSAEPRIAVLAIDPTRRKSGGALLGDRIRMNATTAPNIFMRSIATRGPGEGLPAALPDMIAATKAAGFDLIIVETPGIGQGDAGIVPHVNLSIYVMTPEFGAPSQLEKIDMLDFADIVGDQQVRPPRRRGRSARRRQAVAAQPAGVRSASRNDAGVRLDGLAVQ